MEEKQQDIHPIVVEGEDLAMCRMQAIAALNASPCKECPDDPASPLYKRKLKKPVISWLRIVLHIVVSLIIATGVGFLLAYLFRRSESDFWYDNASGMAAAFGGFLLLCYIVFSLKRITICCIRLYQYFAPEHIRMNCRFEPSCSDYAILSLQKYGFFRGVKKSIARLKRCRPPHGGYDEP